MSLYYETAAMLQNAEGAGGSFKARLFRKKDLKSKPGQMYALVAEAAKWSPVLKGVVEGCGVLGEERKVRSACAVPRVVVGRSWPARTHALQHISGESAVGGVGNGSRR
jgi:hypothetical protein